MTDLADPFGELAARVDQGAPTSNGHPGEQGAPTPAPLIYRQAGSTPDRPRPPVLVDGLIDAGDLVVLGAGRAVGKSWWGMALADMLARGTGRFMGEFAVRQACRVLYCHGELDDWGAVDRWAKLAHGAALSPDLVETFDPWRVRVATRQVRRQLGPDSVTDTTIEAMLDGRLEQTVIDAQIQVLILDPWAAFYGGRENSNDEVEAALGELRRVQAAHGLSVVVLHHFSKGGSDTVREPEDLWRGAGVLADRAATRVTLTPLYSARQAEDQGLDRHQARRYARAHFLRRRHIPPADMAIRWDVETGQWEHFQSTLVDQAGPGSRSGTSTTDMLAKMPDDGWSSVGQAASALGLSEQTTRRLLEAAVAGGHLEEYRGDRNRRSFRRPGPKGDPTL